MISFNHIRNHEVSNTSGSLLENNCNCVARKYLARDDYQSFCRVTTTKNEGANTMGKSATVLGKPYYMTGRQFNFLLMQQGFLEGEPGAWNLTSKGEQFAEIRDF